MNWVTNMLMNSAFLIYSFFAAFGGEASVDDTACVFGGIRALPVLAGTCFDESILRIGCLEEGIAW